MITNFNQITARLTEDDYRLVNVLIKGFSTHDKDHPIKEKEIVLKMRARYDKSFNGVKLRKLVNHIRSTGMLPVIGTSEGYHVSFDPQEIAKQIKSMSERAQSILCAANGMKKFI